MSWFAFRSVRTGQERPTLMQDAQDGDAGSLGDALEAEASLQQRDIAQQLQARMDHAQARIQQAPPELRANIVKQEVSLQEPKNQSKTLVIFEWIGRVTHPASSDCVAHRRRQEKGECSGV